MMAQRAGVIDFGGGAFDLWMGCGVVFALIFNFLDE